MLGRRGHYNRRNCRKIGSPPSCYKEAYCCFQEDAKECAADADDEEEGPDFEDQCSHEGEADDFCFKATLQKCSRAEEQGDGLGGYFGQEDPVHPSKGAQDAVASRRQKAAAN